MLYFVKMCTSQFCKVIAIDKKHVKLDDGRVVKILPDGKIKIGDTVEVYADLVIGKVNKILKQKIKN